jgi:DinB superfamily
MPWTTLEASKVFVQGQMRGWRPRPRGDSRYIDPMDPDFLDECLAMLARGPATLDALLRDLPETWTSADEGPGTWSPYMVVGHLIHGEKVDWMSRFEIMLRQDPGRVFDPFDRDADECQGRPLCALLDEFRTLRAQNLERLRSWNLQPAQLALQGTHPAFGAVTVRQLLATWTAHDLAHILQVSRTMAKRLKPEVGPWAAYLSVMK